MELSLATLIFVAGIGQLSVLVASALVPVRLNWREEFKSLSRLHRQMYWVYGGYVVLSIIALGLLSICQRCRHWRRGAACCAACALTSPCSGASACRCRRCSM